MTEITNLDDHRPHSTTSMVCPCGHKWQAVYQTGVEKLECEKCRSMVSISQLNQAEENALLKITLAKYAAPEQGFLETDKGREADRLLSDLGYW